jgi:hypothetical protein
MPSDTLHVVQTGVETDRGKTTAKIQFDHRVRCKNVTSRKNWPRRLVGSDELAGTRHPARDLIRRNHIFLTVLPRSSGSGKGSQPSA